MILCVSCINCKDYGNGWVFCPIRDVWLKKGYNKCNGYIKGEPPRVQHPSTWSWIERMKGNGSKHLVRQSSTTTTTKEKVKNG